MLHHRIFTKFKIFAVHQNVGKTVETPQNENTKFYPRSAYSISKVTVTRNYRETYNSFTFLFNHESLEKIWIGNKKISLASKNKIIYKED